MVKNYIKIRAKQKRLARAKQKRLALYKKNR